MRKISSLLMMALLAIGMGLTSCDEQLDNAVTPVVAEVTSIEVDLSKIDEKYLDTEKTKLQLTVGDEVTLSFTILPEEMASTEVELTAADATILSIDGLKVKALKEGETKVTAKAGDKTAECTVTVSKTDSDYLKWNATQKKLVATEIPTDATAVSNASGNVNWAAGTYVVVGNVTISGAISLQGAVNLIIKDGAKLTVGRIDGANYDLSIFGQSNMTGELVVKNNNRHAIHSLSTLEIHSCKVTALGVLNGRWGLDDIGTINVYGGSVDSKASENGYGNGICLKNAGSMNIYGGLVKAEGKGSFSTNCYGVEGSGSATITVYGGKLWAGSPNKQAFGSNVTLTKGASFTGKIQTSNDNTTWTDWTTDGTPTTKYVKVE